MIRFSVVVALGGLTALAGPAQSPKPDDPAADKQVVASKPAKSTPAAAVQFRKDLNLPYPSLATLGGRIDAARRAGDPVTLAHAAGELHTAEKVSGKTASLTSKQLIGEAAELAGLRRQEAELKAVLHVSDQVTLAEQNVAELKKLIAMNQAVKRGIEKYEEPRDAPRKVVVNNYTTQYIDVQVNGYLKGQVSPSSTRVIVIEQLWNPIVLRGWGDADETTFGPVVLQGRFTTYTWNINADDAVPNRP
jgi:hypothetical protein